MNPKPNPGRASLALGLVLLSSTAFAQQGYYQPQPPRYTQPPPNYYNYQQLAARRENPLDLIPKMGQKVGQWVRRVFYGESAYQGYAQSSPYGGQTYNQPQPYSAPPSSGYYQQPTYQTPPPSAAPQQQPPRYNYPPAQSQRQAPKSESPSGRVNGSTRQKYTPPKVQESKTKNSPPLPSKKSSAIKPKPESSPPPEPKEKESAAASVPETVKPKEEPPSTTPPSSNSGSFLKGKKTSKPGRVISPYPPYKELDITGLDSGSLALDPTTQKVFEVP